MSTNPFLDLCISDDRESDLVIRQLQDAGVGSAKSRFLRLHAHGPGLQLSVQQLADAFLALLKEAEEILLQTISGLEVVGEASDSSKAQPSAPVKHESRTQHWTHSAHTSASPTPGASCIAARADASIEPGKLDMESFPSLGSSRPQKAPAKAPPEALMRLVSQSSLPGAALTAGTAKQKGLQRRVAPTPVPQVVRNPTFTAAAAEVRPKAKSGRKVTPTPVDKPLFDRSFAAAASPSSSALSGSSPISSEAAAGQLSASSARESSRSAWPQPSWAGHPGHSAGPATATASDRMLAGTDSSSFQPSLLSGASPLANGASSTADQAKHESASGVQDSLARRVTDMHVIESTQPGLQHAPVQTSTGAGLPSIPSWRQASPQRQENCPADSAPQQNPKQVPAGRRSGSPCQQAGSGQPLAHPMPQLAPAQARSDCGAQTPGAWRHTAALQQEAHSPAASSAPGLRDPPDTQGALAATPGSADIVSGRQTVWQPQKGRSMQATDTCPPALTSSPSNRSQQQLEELKHSRAAAVLEGQPSADEAVMGPGEEPDLQGELPDRARRAAALHSALIRHTAVVQLADELESLFRLLGMPAAARAKAGKSSLLPTGSSAAQYACCVLSTIGSLDGALPMPQLEALASSSAVTEHAPELAQTLQRSLSQRRSAAPRVSPAHDMAASAFGVHAFTSDGQARRSKEEQRLVSNREATRDAWFRLLREASSAAGRGSASQRDGFGCSHVLQDPGMPRADTPSCGGTAAAYEVLSEGAPELVRSIHAQALPHFARLLTAVVLQAAAAGEALLDKELTDLAQRDMAKFSRLNQRLQGQASTGKAAGVPAKHGHQGSPGTSEASWRGTRRTGVNCKKKGARDAGAAAEDLAASSMEAAWRFPPAQRLFVLFLEATDSHRLATCLIRHMQERLSSLHADVVSARAAHTPQRCEQAIAMSALACFLAHLTAGAPDESRTNADAPMCKALEAAIREGALLWMLPSVTAYAAISSGRGTACLSGRMLSQLAQIRGSRCLRPGHAGFGLPALCMRALLDELALHVPLTRAEGQAAADSAAADEAAQRSSAVEGELDARFVQLCCPQLGQVLQAGVSGAPKEAPKKGLRKIRPTVPVLAPSSAPSVPVPAVVTRLAAGEQSDAKRKLQSAFLAMYSNSESKVRLKSVMDFVSEVLSHTVKERCMKQSVAAACKAAAAQVRTEAEQELQLEQEADAGLTTDVLRSRLQASVPRLLSDASAQAMEGACSLAVHEAEVAAAQALKALAHPSWTDAVIATAAAMAAENAVSACAHSFIEQITPEVAALLQQHVEEIASGMLKTSKRRQPRMNDKHQC